MRQILSFMSLSSLTFHPSGASPGPLIKERVCLSISLTATHAEQRHTNMHTHSRLHLSQWSHLIRSLDTTQRYLEKCFPHPPETQTHLKHSLTGKPSISAVSGVKSTRGYLTESNRDPKINGVTCQEAVPLHMCITS